MIGAPLAAQLAPGHHFKGTVAAQVFSTALRSAVTTARAAGCSHALLVKMLTDELDAHMAHVEIQAAIKVQALYRGRAGKRKARQEAIQDTQALPESLRGMAPRA